MKKIVLSLALLANLKTQGSIPEATPAANATTQAPTATPSSTTATNTRDAQEEAKSAVASKNNHEKTDDKLVNKKGFSKSKEVSVIFNWKSNDKKFVIDKLSICPVRKKETSSAKENPKTENPTPEENPLVTITVNIGGSTTGSKIKEKLLEQTETTKIAPKDVKIDAAATVSTAIETTKTQESICIIARNKGILVGEGFMNETDSQCTIYQSTGKIKEKKDKDRTSTGQATSATTHTPVDSKNKDSEKKESTTAVTNPAAK